MKILKKFEAKHQQQEEYRNKIYTFCYDYLDRKSEYELTPETLLNMGEYEIHELGFPEFLYNAGDVIGLLFEIIYLKFPYLEYYECDDEPAPLSIMKLADLLIEMMMIYQTQWEEFKVLPQHEQDQYYTKLYSIIEKYLPLHNVPFSPDMFINKGSYGVSEYKTKSMIMKCAFVMGLNAKSVYESFVEQNIFVSSSWLDILVSIVLGLVFFTFGTLFFILYIAILCCVWTKKYFFAPKDVSNPMTVKDFADKIIGIWLVERFYQKHKSNDIKENK